MLKRIAAVPIREEVSQGYPSVEREGECDEKAKTEKRSSRLESWLSAPLREPGTKRDGKDDEREDKGGEHQAVINVKSTNGKILHPE